MSVVQTGGGGNSGYVSCQWRERERDENGREEVWREIDVGREEVGEKKWKRGE